MGRAAQSSTLRLGSARRHDGGDPGGFYFGPVIADDVLPDDALAQEEVFGPVVAEEIHAGQVYVNTYGAGGGVEFPFGGFKKSGYGREKGAEALRAFCQTKTVVLKVTG